MRMISVILALFFVFPCCADDFDNPYMNNYHNLTNQGQRHLISNPYFEYYNNLTELTQKYQQAKSREQSTANKLLGGAAIGATGLGAMQMMSGLAEQQSDEAAERDMRAYLSTFMCDYGAGRNIRGGETNIVLPNAGDLQSMVSEYKQLASDIKERKSALNMLPGIESELVLDATEMGLYNNASIGKTEGAFTSLSRALLDENSADAAKWSEQKNGAKSKTKTGATIAGSGAAGGVIGNLIINKDDKNEVKE